MKINTTFTAALVVTIILFGVAVGVPTLSAQEDPVTEVDGTIELSPSEVSLEEGDSRVIEVKYIKNSTKTPQGIEYVITYDPDVISVTDQQKGPYLGGDLDNSDITSPGRIEYIEATSDQSNVDPNNNTVATITIEPVCGINDGATTDLEFLPGETGAAEGGESFDVVTASGTAKVKNSTSACGSDNDNNNDGGSSGGGGGGGAGGGAGGGGGGGGGPTGPPTPAQVENTLNFAEPEVSTTLNEGTTSEESEGESAESDEASGDSSGTSVEDVTFENTESRPVEVADYGDPPETVEEDVINSIAADNEEIAAATGDATSGSGSGSNDNTGEDGGDSNTANGGDSGSEPAEVDVVQFAKINPTEEISDEAQAEVEFSVDRDKVTNPNSLTVYKDAYVFEAQEEQWVEAETTVTEVTDNSIEVTASVDEFSLFAVMEIDDSSAEPTATPDADETSEGTQTEDGIPGFGVGVTLIAVVILSMVIRVNRLGK